jgi:hypothetical protein
MRPASVLVETVDGTAKAGIDFVGLSQRLEWSSANDEDICVSLEILHPPYSSLEGIRYAKHFSIMLSEPSNVVVGPMSLLSAAIQGAQERNATCVMSLHIYL